MKSLFLPILLALAVPCWGQDAATELIQSKLIEAPDSVAEGKLVSILLPPDLPFKVEPPPGNKLSFIDEETGKRAYLILEAKAPGYTITIDFAIVHPTAEERKKARDEIAAGILSTMTADQIKAYVTTQIDAKFADAASKDEVYQDSHFVKVGKGPDPTPDPEPGPGPTPDPTPNPAPIPEPGFRVMFIVEKEKKLPPLQRAIIAGKEVDAYLNVVCVDEPSGQSGWRVFDQNQDVSTELPVWQKAMENAKPESLPWVLISNGRTGIQCALPESPSAFVDLCKKYVVK